MLVLSISMSSVFPTYAQETYNLEDDLVERDYIVLDTQQTKYGEVYFVMTKASTQDRTVWDLVDIVMAGKSWADLFSEPSWGNFAWAVLDTAAILPVLPSTAYVRQGGKYILKVDEVVKFAKTSKGSKAIKAAMRGFSYADGITSSAISSIRKTFKNSNEATEVINLFKKAANKGLVGSTGESGIKKLTGKINNIYTHEIKVTGKYGAYRIFGYKDKSGKWVFDYFKKAHK